MEEVAFSKAAPLEGWVFAALLSVASWFVASWFVVSLIVGSLLAECAGAASVVVLGVGAASGACVLVGLLVSVCSLVSVCLAVAVCSLACVAEGLGSISLSLLAFGASAAIGAVAAFALGSCSSLSPLLIALFLISTSASTLVSTLASAVGLVSALCIAVMPSVFALASDGCSLTCLSVSSGCFFALFGLLPSDLGFIVVFVFSASVR
jgi:hypothetical protein